MRLVGKLNGLDIVARKCKNEWLMKYGATEFKGSRKGETGRRDEIVRKERR